MQLDEAGAMKASEALAAHAFAWDVAHGAKGHAPVEEARVLAHLAQAQLHEQLAVRGVHGRVELGREDELAVAAAPAALREPNVSAWWHSSSSPQWCCAVRAPVSWSSRSKESSESTDMPLHRGQFQPIASSSLGTATLSLVKKFASKIIGHEYFLRDEVAAYSSRARIGACRRRRSTRSCCSDCTCPGPCQHQRRPDSLLRRHHQLRHRPCCGGAGWRAKPTRAAVGTLAPCAPPRHKFCTASQTLPVSLWAKSAVPPSKPSYVCTLGHQCGLHLATGAPGAAAAAARATNIHGIDAEFGENGACKKKHEARAEWHHRIGGPCLSAHNPCPCLLLVLVVANYCASQSVVATKKNHGASFVYSARFHFSSSELCAWPCL